MHSRILATIVSGALLTAVGTGHAALLNVDAKANIFNAGESSPSGGGVLPPSFSFAAGADLTLTFSSVTGTISCCGGGVSSFNGPDGGTQAGGNTNINSASGVSGLIHSGATMFLVGVFTDGTNPADPAPERLNFSSGFLGTAFTDLSPLLDQTFFIGDGLTGTGTGTVQEFHVPLGATTLFLGFVDAIGFTGNPGAYGDNVGTLAATFTTAPPGVPSVPEPTTLALLGSGLLWLAAVRRRKSSTPR